MRLALVKFAIGFAAGLAIWSITLPFYTTILAAAVPIIRIDRRYAHATAAARGTVIRVQGPPALDIRADQITYNVILLFALFAANRAPLRDRNMLRFAASLAITCAVHLLAMVVWIEASYATVFGDWSDQHYGTFAAHVWLGLQLLYQIVGMFAVVFICWWVSSAEKR